MTMIAIPTVTPFWDRNFCQLVVGAAMDQFLIQHAKGKLHVDRKHN